METDVANKVRQTHLPKTRPLMPVFEAIVNAIHAIEDRGVAGGHVEVELMRAANASRQVPLPGESAGVAPVVGFTIRDNGAGFTQANYTSFCRAESSHKLARGGKGIGRFLWLTAFSEVRVASTFRDQDAWFRRTFRFSADVDGGIDHQTYEALSGATEPGSVVELLSLRDDVAATRGLPHDPRKIADAIAQHCTGYLLRSGCPQLVIVDGAQRISVNAAFEDTSAKRTTTNFDAGGNRFELVIVRARPAGGESPHRVRLCAHNREVKAYSLNDDLPQLPTRPRDDTGRRWIAEVYVSGPYLDSHVDSERARFRFEELDTEAPGLFDDTLSMRSLRAAIARAVADVFRELVEPERERWQRHVRDHIMMRSPRYGVLFRTAAPQLANLEPDLPADRLEGELARILYQHVQRVDQDLRRELDSDAPVEEHVRRIVEQVDDVQRNQLAEYMMRRHAILAFLRRSLARDPVTKKWPTEAVLHDAIFPRRTDSTSLSMEQANLWVLDERLAFGDYVLSDLPLDGSATDSVRPDLLVYDRLIAVADSQHPRFVVLFEFKRPGRNDFSDGLQRSPVAQLQNEVYRLRTRSIVTPTGRTERLPASVPIFVYLIADATESLIEFLGKSGWVASAGGVSHVHIDPKNDAVYRHMTWNDLLDSAEDRHRAFFARLNLPSPG